MHTCIGTKFCLARRQSVVPAPGFQFTSTYFWYLHNDWPIALLLSLSVSQLRCCMPLFVHLSRYTRVVPRPLPDFILQKFGSGLGTRLWIYTSVLSNAKKKKTFPSQIGQCVMHELNLIRQTCTPSRLQRQPYAVQNHILVNLGTWSVNLATF